MGVWMHSVAAAWFMTTLTPSPLFVALLQTATSLPVFLLGLPFGALADLLDRRLLVIISQGWLLIATGLLTFLTLTNLANPWLLLALTFVIGIGVALVSPVWQAVTPELKNPNELGSAIAINSLGFNITRAAGPAVGGLIVAATGPGYVFLLDGIVFFIALVLVLRWKREAHSNEGPNEHFTGAIRAGIRYIRFSPVLRSMLVRTFVFIIFASGLWTLLPVVASKGLKLEASGLGLLQGCLGVGALIAALILPPLKERFTIDHLVAAGTVVFALSVLALALLDSLLLLIPVLIAGGVGWLVVTSLLNFAAITYAPKWVQARALAIYLLVFQGGLALGSFIWGLVAENFGSPFALAITAAGLALGLFTMLRWRLQRGLSLDLRPSLHWPAPDVAEEPDLEEGPVLVTVEYRIKPEDGHDFAGAMFKLARARRRIGAARWDLYRDPCNPGRYIESFVVESWAEHLRQCQRMTMTDRAIEEKTFAFHTGEAPPVISRFVAARTYYYRTNRTYK